MFSELMNFLKACWRPSSSERYVHTGSDAAGRQDGLLCYMTGEFSMAVVQANNLLEDQSQVESGSLSSHESGPYGTFVGIYDGHGGPETSRYINDHLFPHLKRFTSEQQSMSMDVIRKAFQATEEGFLSLVTKQWPMKPQIAAVGSCCLVGVICDGTLYIANLGFLFQSSISQIRQLQSFVEFKNTTCIELCQSNTNCGALCCPC